MRPPSANERSRRLVPTTAGAAERIDNGVDDVHAAVAVNVHAYDHVDVNAYDHDHDHDHDHGRDHDHTPDPA